MSNQVRDYQYIDKGITNDAVLSSLNMLNKTQLMTLKKDVDYILGRDAFGGTVQWLIVIAVMFVFLALYKHAAEPFDIYHLFRLFTMMVLAFLGMRIQRIRVMHRFLVRRALRLRPLIVKSYTRFEITLMA